MELEFEGGELQAVGPTEVSLPAYMSTLPDDQVEVAQASSCSSALVIAAGRNPVTAEIVLLTGDGKLLAYAPDKQPTVSGVVKPAMCGLRVYVDDALQAFSIDAGELIRGAAPMGVELLR